MKRNATLILLLLSLAAIRAFAAEPGSDYAATDTPLSYPIVDTGQKVCYGDHHRIDWPAPGASFYGQDAQHFGNQSSYTLSGDGLTVYDNVTGLTWTQSPDLNRDGVIDYDDKLAFSEALKYSEVLNTACFGGYSDWRLPSIKELYSLMDFRGTDPTPEDRAPCSLIPFIDADYFDFGYGDRYAGEQIIEARFWSNNVYVGTAPRNRTAAFGLNFADGHIKAYPSDTSSPFIKKNYVYFVRGNRDYGVNEFVDNGDGTVTDNATGLMWEQKDNGGGLLWEEALALAKRMNAGNHLGYNDWRLPNAKELQSIVDYSRAPDATGSAAIDPIFSISRIINEAGKPDYPWFWTSTTHVRADGGGNDGVYICFGRAMGYMHGSWVDVHGAGAQRSDRKDGEFSGFTPISHGRSNRRAPQGDAARMFNYVRLVRDAWQTPATEGPSRPRFHPRPAEEPNRLAIHFPGNGNPLRRTTVTEQ